MINRQGIVNHHQKSPPRLRIKFIKRFNQRFAVGDQIAVQRRVRDDIAVVAYARRFAAACGKRQGYGDRSGRGCYAKNGGASFQQLFA